MSSYALESREKMLSNEPLKHKYFYSPRKASDTNSVLEWDINPLALPRGRVQQCEICKDRCKYHCTTCRAAFYCSKEHRETDYRTTHKHICSRMDFLNHAKNPICNAERIRALKQNKIIKLEIVSITKSIAELSLFEHRADDALEQLKAAFKNCVDVNGPSGVQLVEIYALYIEAFIKAGDMPKAEEQLRKAEWILLDEGKNCPDYIMADFYKNEGHYNLAIKQFSDALLSFSNEVVYATRAYHQEHPRVATGLFHLGQTFLETQQRVVAFSHFMHTTDIWLVRLDQAIKLFLEQLNTKVNIADLGSATARNQADIISGEQKQDAWNALQYIHQHTLDDDVQMSCVQAAKVTCAAGMTEYLYGHYEKAADMAMKCKRTLHECRCPMVLDMSQDLYRAANKAMHKKDFKAVGVGFKNIAKLGKKSTSNNDILRKHLEVATKRRNSYEKKHPIQTSNHGRRASRGVTIDTIENGEITRSRRLSSVNENEKNISSSMFKK